MLPVFAFGAAALSAQGVDGPPLGVHPQIGAQRAPLGVEAFGLAPQGDEDLLGDVLGGRGITGETAGQAEDEGTVALPNLGQRLLVTCPQAGDQDRVPRVHGAHHIFPLPELLGKRRGRGWRRRGRALAGEQRHQGSSRSSPSRRRRYGCTGSPLSRRSRVVRVLFVTAAVAGSPPNGVVKEAGRGSGGRLASTDRDVRSSGPSVSGELGQAKRRRAWRGGRPPAKGDARR